MWTLTFSGNLNISIQVGDYIFTSGNTTTVDSGFDVSDSFNETNNTYDSTISYLGTVNNIITTSTGYQIVVDPKDGAIPPAADSYIFFSKKQEVNTSSLKGYYNAVRFENNSKTKAELYKVSCSITASSK